MELLDELLKLSAEKEIPYTKKQLEKMSEEKLQAVYEDYKKKELDDFNESVCDAIIFKLDEFMRNKKYIKEESELGKKLQNKKLFRADLKNAVSYVTPFLPFIGFMEGIATVAVEVVEKMAEEVKPSGNGIPDLNKNVSADEEETESRESNTQ